MEYKRRPVLIEAFFLGKETPPKWFTEAILNGDVTRLSEGNCIINTAEGKVLARKNMDYIVKGSDGRLDVCKANVFEEIYERV